MQYELDHTEHIYIFLLPHELEIPTLMQLQNFQNQSSFTVPAFTATKTDKEETKEVNGASVWWVKKGGKSAVSQVDTVITPFQLA